MLIMIAVASVALSFEGLDAAPPSFAGLDARSVRRYTPEPVAAAAIAAWPGREAVAPAQAPPVTYYTRTYLAPVVHYRRPVYVGGFAPSYGYSYAAGSCASGSCARR